MKKLIISSLFICSLFLIVPSVHAALTQSQINSIIGLLQSFGADSGVIRNVEISLEGGTPTTAGGATSPSIVNPLVGSSTSVSCVRIIRNLSRSDGENRDETNNGAISRLQEFLRAQGDYTYPEITGFFGPSTEAAVRSFQARNGIVSSGTPDTTGYGAVGPSTRARIQALSCGASQSSNSIQVLAPSGGEVYPAGSQITVGWTQNDAYPTTSFTIFLYNTAGKLYYARKTTGSLGKNADTLHPEASNVPSGEYFLSFCADDPNGKDGKVCATSKRFTITASGNDGGSGTTTKLPTVDLTLDSSNGPITVKSGHYVTAEWKTANATRCSTNWGSDTGTVNYGTTYGPVTSNTTYTITCYNSVGQSATDSVRIIVEDPIPTPTANLLINSRNSSFTVASGDYITMEWSTTHASRCTNNWNNDTGTVNYGTTIGPVTADKVYTLTCYSSGDSKAAIDSVEVRVEQPNTQQSSGGPTVTLTQPNGGGTVYYGDHLSVRWDYTGFTSGTVAHLNVFLVPENQQQGEVLIASNYLYTSNSVSPKILRSATIGGTTYTTGIEPGNYRVRIACQGDNPVGYRNCSDISDGIFSISERPTTSLNGAAQSNLAHTLSSLEQVLRDLQENLR